MAYMECLGMHVYKSQGFSGFIIKTHMNIHELIHRVPLQRKTLRTL